MKIKSYLLILIMCSFTVSLFSQDLSQLRNTHFNIQNGLALQGYDPVAYFTQQKAVKGKKAVGAVFFQGIKYLFSSEENKAAFKKSPAMYEPQYGGWCAYAMGSDGTKVDVDPETFKIIDGRLYLFYNKLFNNTIKPWNKNETKLKQQADMNWAKIFNK